MRYVSTAALATLLVAGSAFAATPPKHHSKPKAPASSASPAKLSPADQKRVDAIEQYQHDLVNVVALRAEPDYLLGAATLAKPFKNQTPGLDFDSLSQRAATAPGASPAVEWARLGVCKTKDDCPNAQAFASLQKHAADNAAVWIIAMDVAAEKKDHKAEMDALKKAAEAKSYDDYYGTALAAIAKAVSVLPPLPDTIAGAHDGQPDNQNGVRVLVAVNASQSHIRPSFKPVIEACSPDAVAKHKAAKAQCLELAHTLEWGSSPIARAVGLHIHGELDAADSANNEQSRRNLAWQVQQYSGLLQRSLTDSSQASQWLAAARTGGTELSLMLATLRANNISSDAPATAASSATSSTP